MGLFFCDFDAADRGAIGEKIVLSSFRDGVLVNR